MSSALAPRETLPTRQESSAGGLRDVAQGEDASWGMKRGTRRGDVKFAHGSFSAMILVQISTWSNKLDVFAKKVGVKFAWQTRAILKA